MAKLFYLSNEVYNTSVEPRCFFKKRMLSKFLDLNFFLFIKGAICFWVLRICSISQFCCLLVSFSFSSLDNYNDYLCDSILLIYIQRQSFVETGFFFELDTLRESSSSRTVILQTLTPYVGKTSFSYILSSFLYSSIDDLPLAMSEDISVSRFAVCTPVDQISYTCFWLIKN